MDASLEIITSENQTQRRVELGAERVRVGRSSRCEIRLPTPSVSGHHLTLLRDGGGWTVVDENSTNGTRVNGSPLAPGEAHRLEAGDEIDLSQVRLRFDVDTSDAHDLLSLQETGTLARQLVSDMLLEATDDDMARIEVRGRGIDDTVVLEDSLTRAFLGSSNDALLTLERVDAPRLLELTRVRDGFGIRPVDETGRDKLELNGAPLTASTPLSDGDVIVAGPYTLTFYDPLESILLDLEAGAVPAPSPAADAPADDESPESIDTDLPADHEAHDAPADGPAEQAEPEPSSGALSPTEWLVLGVAVFLMASALVVILVVFKII